MAPENISDIQYIEIQHGNYCIHNLTFSPGVVPKQKSKKYQDREIPQDH